MSEKNPLDKTWDDRLRKVVKDLDRWGFMGMDSTVGVLGTAVSTLANALLATRERLVMCEKEQDSVRRNETLAESGPAEMSEEEYRKLHARLHPDSGSNDYHGPYDDSGSNDPKEPPEADPIKLINEDIEASDCAPIPVKRGFPGGHIKDCDTPHVPPEDCCQKRDFWPNKSGIYFGGADPEKIAIQTEINELSRRLSELLQELYGR